MRFKRRSARRPLIVAILVLGSIAAVWTFVTGSRPQVAAVFPEPGAFAIPAPAPLRISFSRPMNPDSVQPAIETRPPRSGSLSWDGETASFTPDEPWPRGATVTVTLSTAARSSAGIGMAADFTWSFRTAPTMLAYLWPAVTTPGTGADLYALDPLSGDVTRLTTTDFGVLDYDLAPDGLSFLLSISNASNGADIARLDLLSRSIEPVLACGRDLCISPQYAPDGRTIGYANATTRQILVISEQGEPVEAGSGFFPAWSPDGLLLAYDPALEAYFAFDPASRARTVYPNDTGEPANWSPQGAYFLAPAITRTGTDSFASHILRYAASGLERLDLTADPGADDNAPVVSPAGDLVAFARRWLAVESWTPGRQLWVMAADGSGAAALTSAGLFNHTAFTWHPDNAQLAYVRSNQADLNEPPEIWMLSIAGGAPIQLVINGFAPAWMP